MHCLVARLAPSDVTGPKISYELLLQAGIQRTSSFCRFCSQPVCPAHSIPRTTTQPHPRCQPDCRERAAQLQANHVFLLDKYVPDWRRAGPPRCEVCNRPAARYSLCGRHYQQVKAGRPLRAKYQMRYRDDPVKTDINLERKALEQLTALAEAKGIPVSHLIEDFCLAGLDANARKLKARANAKEALTKTDPQKT